MRFPARSIGIFSFNTLKHRLGAASALIPTPRAAWCSSSVIFCGGCSANTKPFVPLREELQFIDDYLDIEVARFGKDNLDIVKHN